MLKSDGVEGVPDLVRLRPPHLLHHSMATDPAESVGIFPGLLALRRG